MNVSRGLHSFRQTAEREITEQSQGCVLVNVAQLANDVDAFFEREASDD